MNPSHELTHVDLFSGIGGFSLAAESCGLRTVVFVERDAARQRDLAHHWPGLPLVADVNDVDSIERAVMAESNGKRLQEQRMGQVDGQHFKLDEAPFLLTAGVPCQPASAAGKRQGSADDRWLWPQTLRVVARLRPRWCVFENPLGLASLALPAALPDVDIERLRGVPGRTIAEIIRGLDALGYDLPRDRDGVAWIPCVPAVGVGAFHGRDRLWIIARNRNVGNAACGRMERMRTDGREIASSPAGKGLSGRASAEPCGTVDNADGARQQQRCEVHAGSGERGGWQRAGSTAHGSSRRLPSWAEAVIERGADGITRPVKPGLRLLANGIPGRVAKLRGLGNAILPLVASQVIAAIKEQG